MLAREAVLLTLPSDGNRPHWSYHHTGTLTRLISFVSHSCENCRVCTQNSHSETPYCAPLNVPSIHLGGGVGRFFRSVHSAFPMISALNPSFPFFQLSTVNFQPSHHPSPLAATLMDLPASVANKRLTKELNPLDATLTKNRGYPLQAKYLSLSSRSPTFGGSDRRRFNLQTFRSHSPVGQRLRTGLVVSPNARFDIHRSTVDISRAALPRVTEHGSRVTLRPICIPCHYPSCLLTSRANRAASIFRMLFQVPYPVSLLFATLTKTAGVCTNNSHSGTLGSVSPTLSPIPNPLSHRFCPATLFHPWHANASANTFSPIFTGAKRSRAPFAFRRIPRSRSRATISIAGSKLAQDMVK